MTGILIPGCGIISSRHLAKNSILVIFLDFL